MSIQPQIIVPGIIVPGIIVPEIEEIVKFYTPELVERVARETGFVQRESMLGGIEFLGVMTQGLFAKPDSSLSQMSAMARDLNPEVKISKQGFDDRINEHGVAFLKKMLSKAMELSTSKLIDAEIPELLNNFSKAQLLDSTYIQLPGNVSSIWRGTGGDSSKAGMKLQLMIDYKSGKYESIVTTDGVTPDQKYMGQAIKLIGTNELLIYDLGYFKQEYMMDISEKESYFISRFNYQVALYVEVEDETSGKKELRRFHLEKELKKLDGQKKDFHEFELWIMKSGRCLKIRLIVEKVPNKVLEERRKKAKRKSRKRKRKRSSEYLYFQSWNLYNTNIQKEKICARKVILLYKIRWQVEIVFKSWKSHHGLEYLKGKRAERIECFMYGRLIMIVIMCFLFNVIHRDVWNTKKKEVSLLRVVKHFQVKALKVLSLLSVPKALAEFLAEEFVQACRLCLMDVRKRLSTAQKVRMQGQAFA